MIQLMLDFGKNEKLITKKKLYFLPKYMTFNSLTPLFLIVECSLSLFACFTTKLCFVYL